jgi:hypothetical protein
MMGNVNHYDLSSILGSTILGKVPTWHGPIEAINTVRAVRALSAATEYSVDEGKSVAIDKDAVFVVFREVRANRGDEGSSDFYIADADRNAELVAAWRARGIQGTVRQLNKCLMNGRKASQLKGLESKRFTISQEVKHKIGFVCEFVASQMRYEFGASVDDIICDPELSQVFHERCSTSMPGHSWLEYRWTILSVRKSGRRQKATKLHPLLNLEKHPIDFEDDVKADDVVRSPAKVPVEPGVYAFAEGNRDLYIAGAQKLREDITYLAQERFLTLAKTAFWNPAGLFHFRYITADLRDIRQIEQWMILKKQPLFNVPRAAA